MTNSITKIFVDQISDDEAGDWGERERLGLTCPVCGIVVALLISSPLLAVAGIWWRYF